MTRYVLFCVALVAVSVGSLCSAETLTFDDITSEETAWVPDDYGGFLVWDTFVAGKASLWEGSGYYNGLVSGDYVAYNGNGNPAEIQGESFNIAGAYFTAAWNDGLNIDIEGYRDGSLVYTYTAVVDTSGPTWVQLDITDVAKVRFTSYGGTHNPEFTHYGTQFAMDDLSYSFNVSGPDLCDLNEGARSFTPLTVQAGQPLEVHTVIHNTGDIDSGAVELFIYASTDQNITASDHLLGWGHTSSVVPAGGSAEFHWIRSFPAGTPAGTYYVGWIIDPGDFVAETNEDNNIVFVGQYQLTVGEGGPDLRLNAGDSYFTPASIAPDEAFEVHAAIFNEGDMESGPFTVRFFASDDIEITPSDYVVGEVRPASMAASAWDTATWSGAFPPGIPGGTYYVGVIVDADNEVDETDEQDNSGHIGGGSPWPLTVQGSTGPDLYDLGEAYRSFDPRTVLAGQVFSAASEVANAGSDSGEFHTKFYASTDTVITSEDYYLGESWHPGIGKGDSSSVVWGNEFPADIPAGTYYVGWIIDADDEVEEINEDNNTAYKEGYQLVVEQAEPVDLYAFGCPLSFSPQTLVAGEKDTFSVTCCIANSGSLPSGPFKVSVYASSDAVITSSDYFLVDFSADIGPSVNVSYNTSGKMRIDIPAGTYYVGCIIDSDDDVAESNENNNTVVNQAEQLAITPSVAVRIPQGITLAAQDVTENSAMLRGRIFDDGGEPCGYRFRYRRYGDWTLTPDRQDAVVGQVCGETIANLAPGKTYHFQFQTWNSAGEGAWGPELSFVTVTPRQGEIEEGFKEWQPITRADLVPIGPGWVVGGGRLWDDVWYTWTLDSDRVRAGSPELWTWNHVCTHSSVQICAYTHEPQSYIRYLICESKTANLICPPDRRALLQGWAYPGWIGADSRVGADLTDFHHQGKSGYTYSPGHLLYSNEVMHGRSGGFPVTVCATVNGVDIYAINARVDYAKYVAPVPNYRFLGMDGGYRVFEVGVGARDTYNEYLPDSLWVRKGQTVSVEYEGLIAAPKDPANPRLGYVEGDAGANVGARFHVVSGGSAGSVYVTRLWNLGESYYDAKIVFESLAVKGHGGCLLKVRIGPEQQVHTPVVSDNLVGQYWQHSEIGGLYLYGALDDDGHEPCYYRFRYRQEADADWTFTDWKGPVVSGESMWTRIDPEPGTTYLFSAQAQNTTGRSEWVPDGIYRVPQEIPLQMQIQFDPSLVGGDAVTFSGTVEDTGGEPRQYRWGYALESSNDWTTTLWQGPAAAGQNFDQTITGLEPEKTYVLSYQMQTSEGQSRWSEPQVFATSHYGDVQPGRQLLYVDDDAPADPGKHDLTASAPAEDGSEARPYDSIQEAIDAADDGHVIMVKTGSYYENVNFSGKAVVVRSSDDDGNLAISQTILDGGAAGPVVTFAGGEDANSMLVGFTITGGRAKTGGGIACYSSRPTVAHCVIAGNRADLDGGGIECNASGARFVNCTISGNYAGTSGGGVVCHDSNDTFVNCIVWGNAPDAIRVAPGRAPEVLFCDLEGGWWDESDIDADPCFVVPGYWTHSQDANIPVDPCDPNAVWIAGDYHLKSEAGHFDVLSEMWQTDSASSPCIGKGDPNSSTMREPSPNGGRVNMGAYGATPQASKTAQAAPELTGLAAHWKLDEAEGRTAADNSGNGHDGSLGGAQYGATWLPTGGHSGGALSFDGEYDCVDCGTFNPSEGTGQLTVSLWTRWNGPNGNEQGLVAKASLRTTDRTMWSLAVDAAGQLELAGADSVSCTDCPTLPMGRWAHVAATFDGVTASLYLDGSMIRSGDFLFGAATDANVVLGNAQWFGKDSAFDGDLDDVRIYDRALSATELVAMFGSQP